MQVVHHNQDEKKAMLQPVGSSTAFVMTLPLQEGEKKILSLKYNSKPFGKMDGMEIGWNAKAILLRLHVITGWALPSDEYMGILSDQFQKKLQESYGNVNMDEIEHAFRMNETGVKDWGKAMNLFLFDEIMQPYLSKRFELSKIEEQAAVKPLPALPGPKMTDQEVIDTAWDVWNVTGKVDYISDITYGVLVARQLLVLSVEKKKQLMFAAISYLVEQNKNTLRPDPVDVDKHRRYAKKIAVARLFQEYKSAGTKIVLP